MKVRIEVSSLASKHQSGVASYTRLLTGELSKTKDTEVYAHYFNFLGRQPRPDFSNLSVTIEENRQIPLRVYAKLQSHRKALAFDTFLPRVDLTIFPNFASWPTVNSKLTATTVHDLTYIYYPEYVESKNLEHLRRVVPRTVKSADIVLTVSNAVKQEIVQEFGVDPSKVIVTHVPPDAMFKANVSQSSITAVRKKYGIGTKKYIFFLGNFEPRKNLKTLIEAYTRLPSSMRAEYRLVLAGGKGWNAHETQQALDIAVAEGADIVHIGYVDAVDRPALYRAASLFVFPSSYEGFGIPILEAMYSGCPIVAADIPVLHETGGDAVLYAQPGDVTKLSSAIQQALTNYPYTAETMRKHAESFSWETSIEAILSKVKQLLK